MNSEFVHPLSEKLLELRNKGLFCDLEVIYGQQTIPCHSHLIVPFCQLFDSVIPTVVDLSSLDISFELLSRFIDVFYCSPINISRSDYEEFLCLARQFKCSRLITYCLEWNSATTKASSSPKVESIEEQNSTDANESESVAEKNTAPFQLSMKEILSSILQQQGFDFRILFNGTEVKTHRFLLAAVFDYFVHKFSVEHNELDNNESDFSGKFFMSTADFRAFWMSLYEEVLSIDPLQYYNYHHLAYYFQYNDLSHFLKGTLQVMSPSEDWVCMCLKAANDHEDLLFINSFATYLNSFPTFNLEEKLVLLPEVFASLGKKLCNENLVFWLLQSLIYCFKGGQFNGSEFMAVLDSFSFTKMDINAVFKYLSELRFYNGLSTYLPVFFTEKLLPNLDNCIEKRYSHKGDVCGRCENRDLEVDRQRLTTVYKTNNSTIRFFNVQNPYEVTNNNQLLTLNPKLRGFAQFSCISHPLDGSIFVTFSKQTTTFRLVFVDAEAKHHGFKFTSSKANPSRFSTLIQGSSYEVDGNCTVMVTCNFSSTHNVCFALPSIGVYCTMTVPVNSKLQVSMGSGSCSVR
ncbi:hypothetical protein RCL1_001908 [Eukaryota sp. TZLM3-RCL]